MPMAGKNLLIVGAQEEEIHLIVENVEMTFQVLKMMIKVMRN